MADVFLSYKREDQQIARDVATDLEAEGFSVFFDVNIDVGDSWDERIERELNAAKACVVLWSPRSCDSKWVRREAREAMARGILCPALIARCKVPMEFSDVQAAGLIGRRAGDRTHAEWRRLCERVGRCVGRTARSLLAAPSVERPSPADAKPETQTPSARLLQRRVLLAGAAVVLLVLTIGSIDQIRPKSEPQSPSVAAATPQEPASGASAFVEDDPAATDAATVPQQQRLPEAAALAALNRIRPSYWRTVEFGGTPSIVAQVLREASIESLRAAAETNLRAQTVLGLTYTWGYQGIPTDHAEADRLLRLAAEQGDALAQISLGTKYGLSEDHEESLRWYRAAVAQGDARAQSYLAFLHLEGGAGVTADRAEAIRLYRLAARQGHEHARYRLEQLGEPIQLVE